MTLDSKQLVQGLNQASSNIDKFGDKLKDVGKKLSTRVSAPLGVLGGLAIRQSMKFEKLKTSLNVLTGSAEAGGAAFEELVKFSAKTPFQLDELAKVNNTLMGFGLNAKQARESLKLLGDVAAVSGGDLTGIGVAFGQSAAEGRLMTRDLLQFINNGVPVLKILGEELGVSAGKVREMASEGQITFPLLVQGLQRATAEGGMFANGMQVLSGTLSGVTSTLKDNLNIALAELGNEIVKAFNLVEVGKDLTKFINSAVDKFKSMSDETKRLIVIIGGIGAAIGPLLVLVGTVMSPLGKAFRLLGSAITLATKAAKLFNLAMLANPITLTAAAIAAVTLAFQELIETITPNVGLFDTVKNIFKSLGSYEKFATLQASSQLQAASSTENLTEKIEEQSQEIKDNQSGLESYTGAVNKLGEVSRQTAVTLGSMFKTPEQKLEEFRRNTEQFGGVVFGGDKHKIKTEGPKAESPLQGMTEALAKQNEENKKLMAKSEDDSVSFTTNLGDIFANGFTNVAMQLGTGTATIGQVFGSLVSMLADVAIQIGKTAIQIGVGMLAVKASFKNPLTAIAAGVALVAIGSVMKGLAGQFSGGGATAFANGGIVSGPTLGLIGEYSGARSNPEVVAPLNKLQGMLAQSGGQNVNVGGEFRIQGQDLVVALQRAERNRKRIL